MLSIGILLDVKSIIATFNTINSFVSGCNCGISRRFILVYLVVNCGMVAINSASKIGNLSIRVFLIVGNSLFDRCLVSCNRAS